MGDGSQPLVAGLEVIIHSEVTLYLKPAMTYQPPVKKLLVARDVEHGRYPGRRWHIAPGEDHGRLRLAFDRYETPPHNMKPRKFSLSFFHYPTDSGVLGLRFAATVGFKDNSDMYFIWIHPTTMTLPDEELLEERVILRMEDYYLRRKFLGYSRGFEQCSVDFPFRKA